MRRETFVVFLHLLCANVTNHEMTELLGAIIVLAVGDSRLGFRVLLELTFFR